MSTARERPGAFFVIDRIMIEYIIIANIAIHHILSYVAVKLPRNTQLLFPTNHAAAVYRAF